MSIAALIAFVGLVAGVTVPLRITLPSGAQRAATFTTDNTGRFFLSAPTLAGENLLLPGEYRVVVDGDNSVEAASVTVVAENPEAPAEEPGQPSGSAEGSSTGTTTGSAEGSSTGTTAGSSQDSAAGSGEDKTFTALENFIMVLFGLGALGGIIAAILNYLR